MGSGHRPLFAGKKLPQTAGGRQEDGTLPLNDTLLNALVINDRAGLYDL